MLGVSLAVMLGLAFSSSDSWLVLHVAFLVLITMTLFLLLSWYWALLSNTHYFFSCCNFQFGQFVGGLNSEIQAFWIKVFCFILPSSVCFWISGSCGN
jgi:hypothetical protein